MGSLPHLGGSSAAMPLLCKLLAICIVIQSVGVYTSYAKQINSNSDLIFDDIPEAAGKGKPENERWRTATNAQQNAKAHNDNKDDLLDASDMIEDELQPVEDISDDLGMIDANTDDETSPGSDGWLMKSVKRVRRELNRLLGGKADEKSASPRKQRKVPASANNKRAHRRRAVPNELRTNKKRRAQVDPAKDRRRSVARDNYDEEYGSGDGDLDVDPDTESDNDVSYYRVMFIAHEMWNDNYRQRQSNQFLQLRRELEIGFRDLFKSTSPDEEDDSIKTDLIDVSFTNDPFKVHVTVQLEITGSNGDDFNKAIQDQILTYSKIGSVGAELDDNYVYSHISDINNVPPVSDSVYFVKISPKPTDGARNEPTEPIEEEEPVDPVDPVESTPEENEYDNRDEYEPGTDTEPEYPVQPQPQPSPVQPEQQPDEREREGEFDCSLRPENGFRCGDGKIIQCQEVCDYYTDCEDGSDEQDCSPRSEEPSPDPSAGYDQGGENVAAPEESSPGYEDLPEEQEPAQPSPDPETVDEDEDIASGRDQYPTQEEAQGENEVSTGNEDVDANTEYPSGGGEIYSPVYSRGDELNCRGDIFFRCKESGMNICEEQQCDGTEDCPDGEDELDCPGGFENECNENEFKCDNICMPKRLQCNGVVECRDGTDEQGCRECPTHQYQCRSGHCIEANLRCDGYQDCPDGDDEDQSCPKECSSLEYQCRGRHQCISESLLCDNTEDCAEGDDEENCDSRGQECTENEFACRNGGCIPIEAVCDGTNDCRYRDDESDDICTCGRYEFKCLRGGGCIPNHQVCDGEAQCRDASDEDNCRSESVDDCTYNEFYCDEGCHSNTIRCDGRIDCIDQTDERNCNVSESQTPEQQVPPVQYPCEELRCPSGKCYKHSEKCDRTPDCEDGSDELNCCGPDQFACRSGSCVPLSAKCNGRSDCPDDSDEDDCRDTEDQQRACYPHQFRCSSGQCISAYARCDRRSDCYDGSDEIGCPQAPPEPQLNLKTYPNSQIIKESREVIFRCRDEGPNRAKVRWSRPGGRPLPTGFTDKNGRLEIPNIRFEDSGKYICEAVGYPRHIAGQSVDVHLTVERYNPIADRPPSACHMGQATCMDGQCIDKNQVCDGVPHCADGSDEHGCSIGRRCQPNQFMCKNSKCVDRIWRCDSENDCGDNSDEESCDAEPSGACRYDEFKCNSGHCIPKSFQCDSTNDCNDGSDEVGCGPPAVIRPPPQEQVLPVGGVLNITCRGTGTPIPVIVWRLNWGHVPEKCISKTSGGEGSLYCPDMEIRDSGMYSCEIINSKGSLFPPDTVVKVTADDDVCPVGFFNKLASREDECINCFCFGVSKTCKSAELYSYSLQPPITSHRVVGVEIRPQFVRIGESPGHKVFTLHHGVQFRASDVGYSRSQSTVPYLALPPEYQGGQLRSYGGFLNYDVQYQGQGRPNDVPDVIISGNGYTLLHVSRTQPLANQANKRAVQFIAGNWKKPDGRIATRPEIMMVLANVENILLRLSYIASTEREVEVININMDSASVNDRGLGSASLVEQCSCPTGYDGDSCERCAPGFQRQPGGPWLGRCIAIEPETCPPGTFGEPRRGIPCRECPCPLTNAENNFANGCSLGPDNEAICNCNEGYKGRRCEQCAEGYTGNPFTPGGYCYPKPQNECNPDGTLQALPDGTCKCKSDVTGPRCDQCAPSSFFLNSFTYSGCIECFCSGIVKQCSSSTWYRDSVSTNFGRARSDHGFNLVMGYEGRNPVQVPFSQANSQLNFARSERNEVLYWSLPAEFLGNKLTAYGGALNYTLSYSPLPGGLTSRNSAPDVVIKSANDLSFHHFRKSQVSPSVSQTYTIPIIESAWQRNDGDTVNREHMLMALADIQAIYIKATYTTVTQEGTLTFVSLDTASPVNRGTSRAYEVEECRCPPEYVGLSCEACAPGNKKSSESGLYLGLCEPCECNGHSTECDPETGVCANCRDNTVGDFCDECAPGFEGNATNGTPRDCQQRGGGDSMSSCSYCSNAGTLTCSNGYCQCKRNVVGQYCNQCRPGTFDLQAANTDGCSECFCSGASNQCYAGNMYRQLIPIPFIDTFPIISDDNGLLLDSDNMESDISTNMYTYRTPSYTQKYWSLPNSIAGDRVLSYGGKLIFQLRVTSTGYPEPGKDVILIGNGDKLIWSRPEETLEEEEVEVRLHEDEDWTRYDGSQASRVDILSVLSNLQYVLIRATPKIPTTSSAIGNVILESAGEVATEPNAERVTEVELCQCPPGYAGTSCQQCATMYYRDTSDLSGSSLGSCKPCQCGEGAESCSKGDRGYVVCQCRPGYSGDRCQYSVPEPRPVPPTTPQPTYEAEITVSIDSPRISIIPVGGSLVLSCSGVFNINRAPAVVNWYKLNGRLPYASDQDRGVLYLNNLQIDDSGIYICQARGQSKTFEDKVTITVSRPLEETVPVIQLQLPYITVDEQRPIDIDCAVSGSPQPDVQWIRLGADLPREAQVDGDRLLIPAARKSDEGMYMCYATNNVGVAQHNITIYVNSQYQPQPPPRDLVYIEPAQVQSGVGQSVELVCHPRTQVVLVYDWTKDGSPLQWNRNILLNKNVLTIREATLGDTGRYICTGMDQRMRRNYTSTAYVSIEDRRPVDPVDIGVPPVIKPLPTEQQLVMQGQDFSIACEATGTPYPTIKWTRVYDSFNANIQQTGNQLRIINAEPANRGMYLCVAENSAGTDQSTITIDVEPRERPAIELHPREPQVVPVGSSASLSCHHIAGIPTPTMTWRRVDGQPMPPRFREDYPGVGVLIDIELSDAGEYECIATNDVGKAVGTLQIIVQQEPRITLEPAEEDIDLTEGDELKVICMASGSPEPTVEWTDETEEQTIIQPRMNTFQVPSQAVLEIMRVTMDDAKVYVCRANNDAGSDVKYLNVRVQKRRGDTGFSDIDRPTQSRPTQPRPYYPSRPNPANSVYNAQIGDTATLSCDIEGQPQLRVKWTRLDGLPLPRNARPDRNNLIISRVEADAGGKYRCNALDQTGSTVTYVTAELIVVPIPYITFHPEMPMTVRANDNVEIWCEVTGAEPIDVLWYADNGRPLPISVQADGQYLRFNSITPADAGRYYCSATNVYGNTTKAAEVVVNRGVQEQRPSMPQQYEVNEGEDINLSCDITRSRAPIRSDITYKWSRTDGKRLPESSYTRDQLLILRVVRPEDQGRYVCEIMSPVGGSNPTYIDLIIKPSLPHQVPQWQPSENNIYENAPMLKLDQQSSMLRIGESTEVECYSSDNTYTDVVWERSDGEPLPLHIKQVGNKLIISNADITDAGEYVCKCKTDEGDLYTTSYKLTIEEDVKRKSTKPKIEHAEVGSNVQLVCDADGIPSAFRWSRQFGTFQSGITLHDNTLRLDNVQARDAGTYICTATTNGESTDYPTILVVTGAIPHFHQAPLSYMSFPVLPSSFFKFNFDITFRPKQPNGLLLFNGQKKGSGDYISLSLNDRYPEFRFDFDGKPVVMRAEEPITLGEWHTIRVNRYRRDGYMTVDDQHPVGFPLLTNVFPLDLVDDLYIGAVPKWDDLPASAVEKRVGFVGCISRLTLQDQIVELYKDAKYKEGITSCEPCADDPCQNDGTCLETQTEMGYSCICQDGFTGSNCAVEGTSCTPGVCGTGRCENTEFGMECYCPLNKTGDRCQYIEHLNEASLAFRGGGYAAYNTPRPSKLGIKFTVRPNSLEDSVLLYVAESKVVSGDFVAVVLYNKHVELRINTAARLKPVTIRSLNPLPLNKWTEIEISRRFGEAILRVGDEPEQKAKATGLARSLNIKTPLYIGGYDRQITLNRDVNITRGFDGCISNLVDANRIVNLIAEIKDAANVQNCGDINEIEPPSGSGYEADDVEGESCNRDPCENGGTCVMNNDKVQCDCPLGFAGKHCEIHVDIKHSANFRGNGYLELDRTLFGSEIEQTSGFAALLFSTKDPNGLLLWWGQEKGQAYNGQDFLAIAIVDGIVELSFRLDGEEKIIRKPNTRVDDGERHIVILKRHANQATLELDHIVHAGESIPTGKDAMSLPGNMFIGGTPDIVKFTGNRFSSGFNGCVHVVEAEHSGDIPLNKNTISAVNVDTCPDTNEDDDDVRVV